MTYDKVNNKIILKFAFCRASVFISDLLCLKYTSKNISSNYFCNFLGSNIENKIIYFQMIIDL